MCGQELRQSSDKGETSMLKHFSTECYSSNVVVLLGWFAFMLSFGYASSFWSYLILQTIARVLP